VPGQRTGQPKPRFLGPADGETDLVLGALQIVEGIELVIALEIPLRIGFIAGPLEVAHGRSLQGLDVFGVGPDRENDGPAVAVGKIGHIDGLEGIPFSPEEGGEKGVDPATQNFREHVHGILVGMVIVRRDEAEEEVAVLDVAFAALGHALRQGCGHGTGSG
jgi:hypothetical protein